MELYSNWAGPKNCKVPLIIYCSKRNGQKKLLFTKYTTFRFHKVLERTVVLTKISDRKNQNPFATEEREISIKTTVASICIFLGFSEKKCSSVVRGDQIKIKSRTKKSFYGHGKSNVVTMKTWLCQGLIQEQKEE